MRRGLGDFTHSQFWSITKIASVIRPILLADGEDGTIGNERRVSLPDPKPRSLYGTAGD